MDEITKLRYNSKLHISIIGDRRNALVSSFRKWKGSHYVPQVVHHAIRWSTRDPLLETDIEEITWRIVKKTDTAIKASEANKKDSSKSKSFTPAKGSIAIKMNSKHIKRQIDDIEGETENPLKKRKVDGSTIGKSGNSLTHISIPSGIVWSENSCAYDSVLTILHSIWKIDPSKWGNVFYNLNPNLLGSVVPGLVQHSQSLTTLEIVWDKLRRKLQRVDSQKFRWGSFTSITALLDVILSDNMEVMSSQLVCSLGHQYDRQSINSGLIAPGITEYASISDWMTHCQAVSCRVCINCQSQEQLL